MASANFDLGQNTIFDNAVDDNDGVDANVDLDVLEELFKDDFDDENETHTAPDNGFGLVEINASTSNDEALRQIEQALDADRTDNTSLKYITQQQNPRKRFKMVTDAELDDLKQMRQSKSTKNSTKWGIKVFQGIFQ